MWGCKPSCSPIRATRGKKRNLYKGLAKDERSSVDGDQVTGNELLYCCITFRNCAKKDTVAWTLVLQGSVLW